MIIHEDATPRINNQEVKELWVAALRSGQYSQGMYYLKRGVTGTTEFRYCPLGVLCDLAVRLKITTWDHLRHDGKWMIGGQLSSLPLPVWEWAGIEGMHPSQLVPLEWNGEKYPIWELNDRYKLSFDQIADLLEAQY